MNPRADDPDTPSARPPAPTGSDAHDVELLPPSQDQAVHVSDGGLTVAARDAVTVASEADRLVLSAATEIVLQVGKSTFTLRADGTILLDGRRMTLAAPVGIHLNPDPARDGGPGVREG